MAISDAAEAVSQRRTRGRAERERRDNAAIRAQRLGAAALQRMSRGEGEHARACDGQSTTEEAEAGEHDAAEAEADDDEDDDGEGGGADGDDAEAEETEVNSTEGESVDDASSRSKRPRSRPVSPVETAHDVLVPPPERFHATWLEWTQYHDAYCEETMQVLPVSDTMNWAEKDRRTRRTVGFKNGKTKNDIPPEWDPYQRTIICTHGWRERNRGEGKRPRQHIRMTGCLFRFIVQVSRVRKNDPDSPFHLEVKYGFFAHNHAITEDTFATYPSSRGIKDPIIEAKVDGMVIARAKRSVIYDYLLKNGQNLIRRDIDNLIARHVTSVASANDDDATAAELAVFSSEDDDNCVSVDETASLETGVISITTKMMREVYARFPEMLFVDCTHKTNRYNYQLMTFMVMNEFGEGMPVQQSLIEANGDWHMDRAIRHFKRANADKWKLLRVIMVDKDMNEIRVLQRHFPETRILICFFHVRKYLKEMSGKPTFGKISVDDKKAIDMLVGNMIRSRSDVEYEQNRTSLRGLCERLDCTGFFDYMERNWHTCQDMWVLGRRTNLPHFQNATNNMVESWFGKFKDGVKSDFSLAQCVRELLASARCKENEYKYHRDRVGRNVNAGYSEEMSTLLRFTTHFAAGKVEPQYAAGIANADEYVYEVREADLVVLVRGPDGVSTISTLDWSCDCEFAVSMKLPCRHVIAYRKHTKVPGTLIPYTRVDERWTGLSATLRPAQRFEYHTFGEEDHIRETKRQRTGRTGRSQNERYVEAVRATNLVANELADIEDEVEFQEMLAFVLGQWRNVRQRRRTGVATDVAMTSPGFATDQPQTRPSHDILTDIAPRTGPGLCPGLEKDSTPSRPRLGRDAPSQFLHADVDEKTVHTLPSLPGVAPKAVAAHDESDEETAQTQPSDPAGVELSQTHSLWSEEVGHVPIVDPTVVRFSSHSPLRNFSPNAQVASASDSSSDSEVDVKPKLEGVKKHAKPCAHDDAKPRAYDAKPRAHRRSDSARSSDSSGTSENADINRSPIKINPKAQRRLPKAVIKVNTTARRGGRKKTDVKQRAVDEAVEFVRFNAAEKARRDVGLLTLEDIADSIDRDKPGLDECARRLAGVTEKFTGSDNNKIIVKTMKNPLLNQDAFYVLPKALLTRCFTDLLANSQSDPIVIDANESVSPSARSRSKGGVELVEITGVGLFSRSQIEVMERVRRMKTEVSSGLSACQWLLTDVLRTVSAQSQSMVRDVAALLRSTYPFERISWFRHAKNHEDFTHTILYRVLPPVYLNDAMIRAVCLRLVDDYPASRVVDGVTASLRHKKNVAPLDTMMRVRALVSEHGVGNIFVPVNFGSAHWCAIMIDVPARVVYTYDPVNHTNYRDALEKLSGSLMSRVIRGFPFTFKVVDAPVQHDLYSCGVFVASFFVRAVCGRPDPKDMREAVLARRRFELFYYVLYGKLVVVDPPITRPAAIPSPASPTFPSPTTIASHCMPGRPSTVPSRALPTTTTPLRDLLDAAHPAATLEATLAATTALDTTPDATTTLDATATLAATTTLTATTTIDTALAAVTTRTAKTTFATTTTLAATTTRTATTPLDTTVDATTTLDATLDAPTPPDVERAIASPARTVTPTIAMPDTPPVASRTTKSPSSTLLASPGLMAEFDRLVTEYGVDEKSSQANVSGVVHL